MIKKIAATFLIFFTLLILFAASILYLVDYDKISSDFITGLKINPQQINNVKLVKYPWPHLTIDSIKQQGKIELENIKVGFSSISLISFQPKISYLEIFNAKVYLDNNDFSIINHDQLINSLIKSDTIDINLKIVNLDILDKQNHPFLTIKNYSLFKTNPLSSKSLFKGIINDTSNFSGFVDKNNTKNNDLLELQLNINNKDYNFQLNEIYKNAELIKGSGQYQINNVANVLYHTLPDLRSVLENFNSKEKILVKFDILPTEETLKLDNVKIDSTSIDGSGTIYLARKSAVSSNIALSFSKIDLSTLVTANIINEFNTKEYGMRFIFADKEAKINIFIENLLLENHDTIKNIQFLSNLEKDVLNIQQFSGVIASGGQFQLTGNITQNEVRSIFDGKIYLSHSDFNSILNVLGYNIATIKEAKPFILSADIKCTLMDLYLQNFLLKTDNIKVSGRVSAKFIGTNPHYLAVLDFSNLDLNRKDYPVISPIIDFAKNLTEDMKGSEYLSKFIPIRALSYEGSFDITLNNLIFNNSSLGKINLLAAISPGNIKISNFNIRKGEEYLSTSLELLAADLKPVLKIKIEDGVIETNSLSPSSLLVLRNKLLNEFSLDKIQLYLDCFLSKLSQGDLILENLKFNTSNDSILFNVSNLEANLLSGNLKGSGNILLNPINTIDFIFALNSIDLSKLSAILPKGMLATSGGASVNGKIFTTGDTLEKLLYNLDIQSAFILKNTIINNFSIDDLIEKINTKNYDPSLLDSDLTTILTTGQTKITNLQGNIALNKGIGLLQDINFTTNYAGGAASLALSIYNYDIELTSILSFYITNNQQNLNTMNNKNISSTLAIKANGSIFFPKKTVDAAALKISLEKKN